MRSINTVYENYRLRSILAAFFANPHAPMPASLTRATAKKDEDCQHGHEDEMPEPIAMELPEAENQPLAYLHDIFKGLD